MYDSLSGVMQLKNVIELFFIAGINFYTRPDHKFVVYDH